MAKKKLYTIIENEDKTVTLQIGGISKMFRNRLALTIFAERLHEMASYQMTGMFRLVEKEDEKVDLVFSKGGEILHAKSYDDLLKLAMSIVEDMHEG